MSTDIRGHEALLHHMGQNLYGHQMPRFLYCLDLNWSGKVIKHKHCLQRDTGGDKILCGGGWGVVVVVVTRHARHSTLAIFNVLFRGRADWMPLMLTRPWTSC